MSQLTVGGIEELLFADYPAAYAVADDRFGLFVGERAAAVSGVAFALDATVPMVRAAAGAGCNLLVTHHPPFWAPPRCFLSADSAATADGAVIFWAARLGVAVLSMHTNVDCAPAAAQLLMAALGYTQESVIKPHLTILNGEQIGLGQLARATAPAACTLRQLGERCRAFFGGHPRVWGDPERPVARLAVCSGAGSELVGAVVAARPDCYVTGELRHHEEVYLADEGIALIELGHDCSELPYRQLMADSLLARVAGEGLLGEPGKPGLSGELEEPGGGSPGEPGLPGEPGGGLKTVILEPTAQCWVAGLPD
ncbi:MAG: Nif3-like dinuclear metal center hexameric protein [Coriobacteriia bacterium]|nr:Nif3-like dinuclear metal center hexameric protein [Coriobacteriia bacterium]